MGLSCVQPDFGMITFSVGGREGGTIFAGGPRRIGRAGRVTPPAPYAKVGGRFGDAGFAEMLRPQILSVKSRVQSRGQLAIAATGDGCL
jgi:hypothetical protein